MRLEIGGERLGRAPDETAIRDAISSLEGQDDPFIILEKQDGTYLQALTDGDDCFIVEYQDGDLDHHYGAVGDVSQETTLAIFLAYFRGDDWMSMVEWEKMDLSPSQSAYESWEANHKGQSSKSGCLSMMAAVVFFIAISVWLATH